jgi:hypothetical protein
MSYFRACSQTEQEDERPIAAYLWDLVALAHATAGRAYIEYNNDHDVVVPSSVSTCSSFITFVTLWL